MFSFLLCGTGDGTQGTTHSKPLSYMPSSVGRLFNPLPHLFLCPILISEHFDREHSSSVKLLSGNEEHSYTWAVVEAAQ